MKLAKLIAMSTLVIAAQALAKGRENLVYNLACQLSTRTKVAVTQMNFNEENGTMSFREEVQYDIFEPVPEKPFTFSIDGSFPGTLSQVQVVNTDKVFNVSASEEHYVGRRVPDVVKEFELKGTKLDSGAILVHKLLINGEDIHFDVRLCYFAQRGMTKSESD